MQSRLLEVTPLLSHFISSVPFNLSFSVSYNNEIIRYYCQRWFELARNSATLDSKKDRLLTILTFPMQLECKSVPSNFILCCAYIACGILVNHRTYSQSACIPTTVKALAYNFTVFVPVKCRWRISFCFTQQGYRTSFQLPQKMNFWFICNEMTFYFISRRCKHFTKSIKGSVSLQQETMLHLMLVFIYNRKTWNST